MKAYIAPECQLLSISTEDIMTLSMNTEFDLDTGVLGSGVIDWGDLTN